MHWVVEPGDFEFRIGASSEDIRLRKVVTLGNDLSAVGLKTDESAETQNFSVPK